MSSHDALKFSTRRELRALFLHAVTHGDASLVTVLCAAPHYADVTWSTPLSRSSLSAAAARDDSLTVSALLSAVAAREVIAASSGLAAGSTPRSEISSRTSSARSIASSTPPRDAAPVAVPAVFADAALVAGRLRVGRDATLPSQPHLDEVNSSVIALLESADASTGWTAVHEAAHAGSARSLGVLLGAVQSASAIDTLLSRQDARGATPCALARGAALVVCLRVCAGQSPSDAVANTLLFAPSHVSERAPALTDRAPLMLWGDLPLRTPASRSRPRPVATSLFSLADIPDAAKDRRDADGTYAREARATLLGVERPSFRSDDEFAWDGVTLPLNLLSPLPFGQGWLWLHLAIVLGRVAAVEGALTRSSACGTTTTTASSSSERFSQTPEARVEDSAPAPTPQTLSSPPRQRADRVRPPRGFCSTSPSCSVRRVILADLLLELSARRPVADAALSSRSTPPTPPNADGEACSTFAIANMVGSMGMSPLYLAIAAAQFGRGVAARVSIATLLISSGADVLARDALGRNALHAAAWMGSDESYDEVEPWSAALDRIPAALRWRALCVRDAHGVSPIDAAALSGSSITLAKLLRSAGDANNQRSYANLSSGTSSATPLSLAASGANLSSVCALLGAGAEVTSNALIACATGGNIASLLVLINIWVPGPNGRLVVAPFIASERAAVGARITSKDVLGASTLSAAASAGHDALAALLVTLCVWAFSEDILSTSSRPPVPQPPPSLERPARTTQLHEILGCVCPSHVPGSTTARLCGKCAGNLALRQDDGSMRLPHASSRALVALTEADATGRTLMVTAAANGCVKTLGALRRVGVPITEAAATATASAPGAPPNSIFSPVRAAAIAGESGSLVALRDKAGLLPNACDANGDSALHWAAYRGHTAAVRVLLASGASTSLTNVDLGTPIHSAAFSGVVGVVVELLSAGTPSIVDVVTADRATPLVIAAFEGHTDFVATLLAAGANARHANAEGRTAIHEAAAGGHDAIVLALLSSGAAIDATDGGGDTAVHWAAHNARFDTVRLLIGKRARIDIRNSDGGVAAHAACINDAPHCLCLLLDAGADINAGFGPGRGFPGVPASLDTPLHCCASDNRPACLAVLLARGANVNAKNALQRTPLHEAIRLRHRNCVETLLRSLPDLSSLDATGRTPFGIAFPLTRRAALVARKWTDADVRGKVALTEAHAWATAALERGSEAAAVGAAALTFLETATTLSDADVVLAAAAVSDPPGFHPDPLIHLTPDALWAPPLALPTNVALLSSCAAARAGAYARLALPLAAAVHRAIMAAANLSGASRIPSVALTPPFSLSIRTVLPGLFDVFSLNSFGDIDLITPSNERLPAHRALLAAACAPLAALLTSGAWREGNERDVHVRTHADALRPALSFLYTGTLGSEPLKISVALAVIELADAWQLPALGAAATAAATRVFSLDTLPGVFEWASVRAARSNRVTNEDAQQLARAAAHFFALPATACAAMDAVADERATIGEVRDCNEIIRAAALLSGYGNDERLPPRVPSLVLGGVGGDAPTTRTNLKADTVLQSWAPIISFVIETGTAELTSDAPN